jgi:hypothetical protein
MSSGFTGVSEMISEKEMKSREISEEVEEEESCEDCFYYKQSKNRCGICIGEGIEGYKGKFFRPKKG